MPAQPKLLALAQVLVFCALGLWATEADAAGGASTQAPASSAGHDSGPPPLPEFPNAAVPVEGESKLENPLLKRKPQPEGSRSLQLLDLRDPFDPSRKRRSAKLNRKILLMDLKDPFAPGRRIAPRGWHIQLPGDLRDPFAHPHKSGKPRCEVVAPPRATEEGITIQRPGKVVEQYRSEAEQKCRRRLPTDLRDPFVALGS